MAAKIKKGDHVVVLTGKDKGRSGEVLQVLPKEDRAVVRGMNMVQRHTSRPSATRRAASRTRKRRSTCRTSPSSTPRTASRPASASASKATRRSASPRRSGE